MSIIAKTNPVILSTFAIALLMGTSSSVLGMEDDGTGGMPHIKIVLKPKGETTTSQDDNESSKKEVLTISGEDVSKAVDKAAKDVSKAVDNATKGVQKVVDKVVAVGKLEVVVQKKEPVVAQKGFRRMPPHEFVPLIKVKNAVAHTDQGIKVVTNRSRYDYQLLGKPESPNMQTRAFRVNYIVDVEEGGVQISIVKGDHNGHEKILGDDVKGQKRLSHPYWKANGKRIEGFLEIASKDFPKYGIVPNGKVENQLAVLVNNVRDGQDEPQGGVSMFTFLELYWELDQEE